MRSVLILVLFLSSLIKAQNNLDVNNIIGKSSINLENGSNEELEYKQSEINLFNNKIKNICDLFIKNEEFKSPKGVDVEIISQFLNNNKYGDYKKYKEPISYNITLFIYNYIIDENGSIYANTSDGAYLSIDINTLSGNFTNNTMLSFNSLQEPEKYLPEYLNNDFMYEPKVIGQYEGFCVYDNGTMVILNNNKSLFKSVSVKEYINGLIKIHKNEIEKTYSYIEENITNLPKKIKYEELERRKAFDEAYGQLKKINKTEAENFKKEFMEAEKQIKISSEQSVKDTAEYRKNMLIEIKNREEVINKLVMELNLFSEDEKNEQAYISEMVGYDSSFLTDKETGKGLVKIDRAVFEENNSPEKIRFIILRTYPIMLNELVTASFDKNETAINYLAKFLKRINKQNIAEALK
ncbi:MAG TPA: hypothetical protein PL041_00880 [Melioribacteraceae bacterium]|nr:hypothetical protein [Melioribacteraceae bacterium]